MNRTGRMRSAAPSVVVLLAALLTLPAGAEEEAEAEPGERSAWDKVRPALDNDSRLAKGLQEEQKREHVRGDLAAETLASMLVESIEGGLIAGLRQFAERGDGASEAEGPTILAASIRDRLDLVLDGTRKRNERVRLPSRER